MLAKRLLTMANGLGWTRLDDSNARRLLDSMGIDEQGLDPADRKVVETLRTAKRPLSLATLAAMVGIRKETIEHRHEPYLLKLGLIEITSQGRVAV